MKLALIPPLDLLVHTWTTDYQLVLPEWVDRSRTYEDNANALSSRGDFIILDNGAAEDNLYEPDELIEMAVEIGASELAIPDMLGDAFATFQKFAEFFDQNEEILATNKFATDEGPNLGFVAQGKSEIDALSLVLQVMTSKWAPYISTVYLPRLLIRESQNNYARINLARAIYAQFDTRLDIHLFGSAPEWPRESLAASTEAPFIRGIDTSMPYNWAFKGRVLGGGASIFDQDPNTGIQNIGRPDDYFDLTSEDFDPEILAQNVRVMHTWTGNIPSPIAKSAL